MNSKISTIENNVQDRTSLAWKKLCEYVDKVAKENLEEFSPLEELGPKLFSQIHTLPETISKLKSVKKMLLYGSKLKRIPPEIGKMEALEYFDPYTSYKLHWFPYEITYCKNLKDSRVSTRALYGNYKNRMEFPLLTDNPVKYLNNEINCSVCGKSISHEETNQLWISLKVGTDILPLLINLCSKNCEGKLPTPAEDYVQFPHKGGTDLKQPLNEDDLFEIEMKEFEEEEMANTKNSFSKIQTKENKANKVFSLIKLIRRFWK